MYMKNQLKKAKLSKLTNEKQKIDTKNKKWTLFFTLSLYIMNSSSKNEKP